MVNSRRDELEFLVIILNDLKINYKEHDNRTLEEILSIVQYRLYDTLSTTEHRNMVERQKYIN